MYWFSDKYTSLLTVWLLSISEGIWAFFVTKTAFAYKVFGMSFIIDTRIMSTCFELGDWALSRVLLKNNAAYPWLILVPRQDLLQEIEQLSQQSRHVFMDEISQLSSIVRAYFKPDKLNIGTLGNIVPQLHMHIIARFTTDFLWPHGVWQADQITTSYEENTLTTLLSDLRLLVSPYAVSLPL